METINTEHGIFTAAGDKTAQEVYEAWLATKDLPPPPNEVDVLRLEMARSNAELFEMVVALMTGGDT